MDNIGRQMRMVLLLSLILFEGGTTSHAVQAAAKSKEASVAE